MRRFSCSPGGAVQRGRRRLRLLFAALAAALAAAAAVAFTVGRSAAGVIAVLLAALPWLAWRAGTDSEVLWLELGENELRIRMRYRSELLSRAGARARRLTPAEIAHLERLASLGGITASHGGYESHLLGEIELYASDLANSVVLEVGERRLVLTPDDLESFVSALT